MLISSDSGGGQIVSPTDDTRFYDDIECLAADWTVHQADARAYVRLADNRWVEAQAGSYAQPDGARTAMGSGTVAFDTAAEARAADRAGRALTFDDVARQAGEPR